MIELYILLGFMIVGSFIALEVKDQLSSIITIGAVGFALTLIFIYLKAPDIAIAQIVVEIICLIILIRAVIPGYEEKNEKGAIVPRKKLKKVLGIILTVIIIAVIAFYGYVAFDSLVFGRSTALTVIDSPSNHYLQNGMNETGAVNIVTSVILDYRGYDTLGEATILFTAIVGVMILMRKKSRVDEK